MPAEDRREEAAGEGEGTTHVQVGRRCRRRGRAGELVHPLQDAAFRGAEDPQYAGIRKQMEGVPTRCLIVQVGAAAADQGLYQRIRRQRQHGIPDAGHPGHHRVKVSPQGDVQFRRGSAQHALVDAQDDPPHGLRQGNHCGG